MTIKRSSVRTRLERHLSEDELKHLTRTAKTADVAENTLRKLLSDDWTQVGRSTIAKICDRWGIGLSDLFELVDDPFWTPFSQRKKCLLLRTSGPGAQTFWPSDASARTALIQFIKVEVNRALDAQIKSVSRQADVISAARSENCIIAGSPRTNRATEMMFAKLFNAGRAKDETRKGIPYRFVFAPDRHVKSALSEPWSPDRGRATGIGLCSGSGEEMFVEVDWQPYGDYLAATDRRARDCGLVLIVNRPFGSKRNVKTIVMAGLTAIGTEGVSRAVVKDYRDLEPVAPNGYTLAVVEVVYNKSTPGRDERSYVTHVWKHLDRHGEVDQHGQAVVRIKAESR